MSESKPFTHTAQIESFNVIFVVGIALFTALLTEGISWYMIYRKPEYKSLTKNIEGLQKKIEKQKEGQVYVGGIAGKSKTADRKLQQLETQLKQYNQELSRSKMTGTVLVAVFMMGFMSFISSSYSGIVVAKLPFEPIGFIQGITHRGLEGTDMTDCSMIFVYILSNISLRPIITKVLGFGGPRTPMDQNPFFAAQQ